MSLAAFGMKAQSTTTPPSDSTSHSQRGQFSSLKYLLRGGFGWAMIVMENSVERSAKLVDGVRLQDEIAKSDPQCFFLVGWTYVSGSHDDWDVLADSQQFASEIESGHARHRQVGDYGIKILRP